MLDIISFADDTTLLYSHPDIQINLINKELSDISKWFKANKLFVNASKTNFMVLGTSHISYKHCDVNKHSEGDNIDDITNIVFQIKEGTAEQNLEVILDKVSLESVNSTNFLGVIIDENLTCGSTLMQYPKRFQEILVCQLILNILCLDIHRTHYIAL